MKYIIYQLVQPEHLSRISHEGYRPAVVERTILEKLSIAGVKEEHDTMESALAEIAAKADDLKNLELTIIPVISINWDGEIH